jgi:hypothetical protein
METTAMQPTWNSTLDYLSMSPTSERSTSHQGVSATATISDVAFKYVYVCIGIVGCLGNMMVIVIIGFYSEMVDKVCD